ncbi:MAG: hypothetical protein LBP50_07495 [Tannerella sp.]|jgi:hypothetical protein|nr:hypothetical protein [Tannerella sp.]
MEMNRLVSIAVASFALVSCSQTYDVGTAAVSIEPSDETVSLALAGYANPPLGRFTIAWEDRGALHQVNAMACVRDRMYVLSDDGLAVVEETVPLTLGAVGKAPRFISLTACNGILYGLSAGGAILANGQPESGAWKQVGAVRNATAIAASDEKLYVTADSLLLEGCLSGDDMRWEIAGQAENVISLACDGKKLYAATADNFLLQRRLNRTDGWTRIGYDNGETYTIRIRHLVYMRHKLYALAADRHLYSSRHHTEGLLSARAMAIGKGKRKVVIAGVDVCGLDESFTRSVREEIARRKNMPEEAILINASHTHFAPVTQGWPTWGQPNQAPDTAYLNLVRSGLVRAIEEALDHMQPARLSFGRDTTGIGKNRSLPEERAVYDNRVDVLQAESVDGKRRTLLFLTGCHPVYTDTAAGPFTLSANYPGHAREILRREGYVNCLFLQGCAGDINPKHPFRTSGAMLAADVLRTLNKGLSPISGTIRFKADVIEIPVLPWTKEEIQAFREEHAGFVRQWPGGTENDLHGRNTRWADRMLRYGETRTMPATMPIHIQTFDIGNWKLIALSREATTEFGLALKQLWPDRNVSVIAYTNDVSSYLATDPHIAAKDYEGYGSFFWYGQPAPFPQGVLDTVVEHVKNHP